MNKKDFNFELPKELIAQDPVEDRSSSRLMVLNKETGEVFHKTFKNIVELLKPGDCLVLNNTRVIPARLIGEKEASGGQVELLLLKRKEGDIWETLAKPGRNARLGQKLIFADGLLKAEVIDIGQEGNRYVKFKYEGIFEEILDKLGQMPLPPYINHELKDKNRYQTVYAKYDGSAAAPTAGLHFTKELLKEIEAKGVIIANITLHVGLGTFRPVKEDNILKHHMHRESYMIEPDQADKINKAKINGGRIICVGTTSCRTIESAANEEGLVQAGSKDTSIFIYPGYKFKVLDCLITNFHLPESTLIILVSALAGKDKVLNAYKIGIEEKYKFFSFGDGMFIY